jgi:cell wall-associated NlpC family hydrolase
LEAGKRNLTDLDPRLNAYRRDLADVALRHRIDAPNYTEGRPGRISAGRAPLLCEANSGSRMGSELLFGESVSVFETRGGWSWVQSREDGYVGYLRADAVGEAGGTVTHVISVLRTFLFSEPDIKAPVLEVLSMNSPIRVTATKEKFVVVEGGGCIWADHIAGLQDYEEDHAAVALRFLGTPYLWGGRSSIGLDCSGLVQMALARCGREAPRDSDMQSRQVGVEVPFDGSESALRHGDLVFWDGHVGFWLEGGDFVHANATDMMVSRGRFAEIARRIREATGGDITLVRRP